MPLFEAVVGEIISSSALRDAIGNVGVLANDISVTSVDTFVDCPGLAVQLDGATFYEIDGYIAYSTGTTPDIQFSFGAPPDVSGSSTFFPQAQAATGGVGSLEGFRQTRLSDSFPQGAAGIAAGSMVCLPHAGLLTFRFGGALQLRFCQVTSTASATTVLAGSWIRATKITDVNI